MLDTLFEHTDGLRRDDFALVASQEVPLGGERGPAGYQKALAAMGLNPADAIAVEDSPANQACALAAELQCYLFPGEYACVGHDVLVTRDIRQTVENAHGLWASAT